MKKNGLGLGLRPVHYRDIIENKPAVDFFEIISENFMVDGGNPLVILEKILANYTVVLHGVSMSIGSAQDLNYEYLDSLKKLTDFTKTPYFTDHLCWGTIENAHLHDLLPIPYTEENANYLAEKAKIVQDYIGLPFGIENLSSYAEFKEGEMTEWEFLNHVVEKSGCHYMLDINNIYVSSENHNFNPYDYVDSIKWDRVLQCHIAGHERTPSGLIVDTHNHHVCDEVWDIYKYAWKKSEGFLTLLEWDSDFLSFDDTHAELLKAKTYQEN